MKFSGYAVGDKEDGTSATGARKLLGEMLEVIIPKPGTNTFCRSGMYMHGGDIPGSAGWVDLTGQNDNFHKWLKNRGKPINMTADNIDLRPQFLNKAT